MSFTNHCVTVSVLLATGVFLGQAFSAASAKQEAKEEQLAAALVRAKDAVVTTGDWGHWLRYFRGDTHGSRDLVVLAVTLKPGEAPHPPHQHTEEELMIVVMGSGVWQLDGKEMLAETGDVVYAAPWTMHGLRNNSGEAPLMYYMVKWSGQGIDTVKPPVE